MNDLNLSGGFAIKYASLLILVMKLRASAGFLRFSYAGRVLQREHPDKRCLKVNSKCGPMVARNRGGESASGVHAHA